MNPRPKVCHLMHDGSGRGGGATFALLHFPAHLPDFDTFAITGRDGDLAERLRARGVRTLTLPMERPWWSVLSWPQLVALLRRERPDVLVAHGQWGGFFAATAARFAGIRRVVYYTHFPSFYADWDLGRVVRNRIAESVTCRLATKIVCLSSAGRYQYLLRQLADESKLLHIPNGIDSAVLTQNVERSELYREMGLPPDSGEPVVVSVGRLADQKRIAWLLRAWARVETATSRGWLAIVGHGPEEAMLHRLAEELGLRRCRFLGPRADGYRYFRAADFGVICSLFEGHPLALLEAMFLGCAMIGTRVDGIGETIANGKTGLLVPPADPAALAQAILDLLADPARARQLGEAGRLRADELYRADKIVPRQLQVIRDVLAAD